MCQNTALLITLQKLAFIKPYFILETYHTDASKIPPLSKVPLPYFDKIPEILAKSHPQILTFLVKMGPSFVFK